MNFELAPDLDQESLNNLPKQKRWYHEKVQGNDRLLITIGDSWTWGDSLPEDSRTDLIYGNLLSEKLCADFVNLAACAASNIEMHDRLSWIMPRVLPRYKQIFVVITLTENGREIVFDPIWTERTSLPQNLVSFQIDYERAMFETFLKTFRQWPQVKILLARNFTYTHDANQEILADYLIPDIWVDVLARAQDMMDYPKNLRLLSQMAMTPLIAHFKKLGVYNDLKMDFFETFMAMEEAIEWLDRSSLNSNTATRHPTAEGHRLWSDYLQQYLEK